MKVRIATLALLVGTLILACGESPNGNQHDPTAGDSDTENQAEWVAKGKTVEDLLKEFGRI